MEPGDRFGLLAAVRCVSKRKWEFNCDCGGVIVAQRGHVSRGSTRSCGCMRAQWIADRKRTHGHAVGNGSIEYSSWLAMRARCLNKRHTKYQQWGGRGIIICERWDDFGLFLSDMGPRPSIHHSLDRIDNDGNYEPDNCRWATRSEQALNTRGNAMVHWNGQPITIAELSMAVGVPYGTLWMRLRRGVSIDRAVQQGRLK